MTDPDAAAEAFARDGFCVLPGFYDEAAEVAPIREGIREIVALLARRHGVDAPCDDAETAMTRGYRALIAGNRAWGGEVYDAVKQIPAFMQLVANPRNTAVFERLRPGARAGLAAGGYGIRIDNPAEEKFRTYWHQEFPAQLRSLDGIVFWSPLLEVTPEMGPVEIAAGSHAAGLVPVVEDDGGVGRTGAYSLRLDDEAARLAPWRVTAPLSRPGDLILMDFLTLHQSGRNVSDRPRWSMQFRYFNFRDAVGLDIAWAGSFAAGRKFEDLFPSLKRHG
jgi:ectoine hydroxylase-related dioxygenase (phytanoyl-CoA dioxygenase family)